MDCIKTTPLKMGSISKKLLTPCRRVGLCRKVLKTTPTTTTPLKETLNLKTQNANTVETPVKITNDKPIDRDNKQEDSKCSKPKNAKKAKLEKESIEGKASKRSKVTKTSKVDTVSLKEVEEIGIEPVQSCSVVENISINEVCNVNSDDLLSIKDVTIKTTEYEVDSTTSSNRKGNGTAKKNRTVKKSFAKCLSMKRTSTSDDSSDLEDSLSMNMPAALTEPVGVDNLCVDTLQDLESEDENIQLKVVATKSCKQRIIYSSDEDDFLSSQNSSSSKVGVDTKIDFAAKLVEVKQRIADKRAHLEKLQQAAIYKKLHNINQLNELTEVWKKGCQEALRYLLDKLQGHGSINMTTLLRNLNIPEELFNYSVNSDSFS